MNPIITLDHINKSYGDVTVLHDITLSFPQGSFTVIVGPSGCGKSTLLKILTGIESATTGTCTINQSMSMVFQNGSLLPWLDVRDNIMLGLESSTLSNPEKASTAQSMIQLMGLDTVADHFPRDLSGGQRQRVGIARALASNPEILLLDEPFSALDAETTENLHEELLKLWKLKNLTIVMISHSLDEAVELADKIYVMKSGKIIASQVIDLSRPRDTTSIPFHNIKQELKKLI